MVTNRIWCTPGIHTGVFSKLQICGLKLLEWFSNNYMEMNADNCHHILVLMMKVRNGEVINKSQIQKLLGVHIDYELKFNTHIETLCEKM